MTTYDEQPIRVWRRVRTEQRECEFGETHTIFVYAAKVLGPVMAVKHEDVWGYGQLDPIRYRLDRQNRLYKSRPPMDFHGQTTWSLHDEPEHDVLFYTRPMQPAYDMAGNRIPG